MKKLLIITLGLFSAISFAEITNYDTSRYENLININVQNIITPKVVIFETDQNLDISKTILLDENKIQSNILHTKIQLGLEIKFLQKF